ncbi:hypothetical protein C8D87_113135 [Lentzea atacamensis]|uniref:Uncharacterized protein n=1 Tax=Lentzea atacamensis TaxID=531938 RepID=A0ABX9DZ32_9PSEU|nr:hypothetical protein [Lentzea atacamensis]RAS59829.1 hypothetical protein C8D87_113135 [Lentzea atacamensis]
MADRGKEHWWPMRNLVAAVVALGLLVGGCVPQAPYDPIAVRLTESGQVEIVYTSCQPLPVVTAEVVAPGEQIFDDGDPRLWQVDFSPPADLKQFVVGETPSGAVDRVPFQQPQPGRILVARIVLHGDLALYHDFTLDDLSGGKVTYRQKNMAPEDFRRETSCG